MAFCKNCGSELAPGSVFCPNCGSRVEEDAGAPVTGAPVTGAPMAGGPTSKGTVNIQARSIAMYVILSIVTCGTFGLVWFFNMVNDLNTADPRPDDKTPGIVLLLSIVTCGIYQLIWAYKAGEKVDHIRTSNGEAASSSSVIYLVLCLFGLSIVTYCLIQSELNKVAAIPASSSL